jgi:hypothetical protein
MVPHYISQDMLAFLSAAGPSALESGQILYSDRAQANTTGQFLTSPNRKAVLWMSPSGNLTIMMVKNPADFIVDETGAFTDGSLRYESYNLFNSFPEAKTLVATGQLNAYTTLQVSQNSIGLIGANGKTVELVKVTPGPGLVKLEITDDGNLQAFQGPKPIWNLFAQNQQSGNGQGAATGGFNLQSLLIPGLAVAAFLFLRK